MINEVFLHHYSRRFTIMGISHFVANGSTCFNKGLIKMSLWKFMARYLIGHGNLNVTICFIHERSLKILLTYGAWLNKKRNISCRCGLRGINWKLTKKRNRRVIKKANSWNWSFTRIIPGHLGDLWFYEFFFSGNIWIVYLRTRT